MRIRNLKRLLGIFALMLVISCGSDEEYNKRMKDAIVNIEAIHRNSQIAVTIVNQGFNLSFQSAKGIDDNFKKMYNSAMEGIKIFTDSLDKDLDYLKKNGEGKDSYIELSELYGDVVELTGLLKGGNLDTYNTKVVEKNSSLDKKIKMFKLKYKADMEKLKK